VRPGPEPEPESGPGPWPRPGLAGISRILIVILMSSLKICTNEMGGKNMLILNVLLTRKHISEFQDLGCIFQVASLKFCCRYNHDFRRKI
jgi:uncharacterized membrane protein YcfT